MTYIDNLLISFPSETSNECIQDVWLEVENCITDGSVLQGGVADMDKNELQVLYEWARVSMSAPRLESSSSGLWVENNVYKICQL